ncbi:MAG: FmdB family zinc ribbon protein [Betaproteobacteria bacterium]
MPIYAYKCDSCGHAKDVLQKMSDDPLTKCPSCGSPSFNKQLTAAGFQLKGSGWYATDFKGGSSGTSAPATADAVSASPADAGAAAKPSDAGAAKPAGESSASSAPAACAASCACH